MSRRVRSARTYLMIYGLVLCTGLLLFLGARLVPRSLIQKHMEESAWLLTDNTVIYNWVEDVEASKAHRYSDCVTLSIAYQMDELPGLKGPLRAGFYWSAEKHTNHNFSDAVHQGLPANENYSRYWHGSAALMRLAHVFTSIGTIYNVHFVLATLLFLLLLWQLTRLGMPDAALCTVAALLMVSAWWALLTLESTWMFLLMLSASVLGVELIHRGREEWCGPFFFAVGMIAIYLDFFTTETVTLTCPLLLMLTAMERRGADTLTLWRRAGESAAAWLAGYAGMWATKWVLALTVVGGDSAAALQYNVNKWLSRNSVRAEHTPEIVRHMWDVVLERLFPLEYGPIGRAVFWLLVLLVLVAVLLRWKRLDRVCALYALVGCVPFARFTALRGHTAQHYFFTYRALAGTMLAIGLILAYLYWPYKKEGTKREAQ